MTPIDQIIRQEINPFDPVTFQTGNFWQERQDQAITVDSIHQSVITQIEGVLDQVTQDHYPRTLLLAGDSGSGKSYLLARLKRTLNPKAFFAYIEPWPDSDYIWRHILRQTVDSLMHVPEGQEDSQLLLWIKSLPALKNSSLMKQLLGEQKKFISDLTASYPTGLYNPKEFFKVLYHLTNPELQPLACYWLRGDELDEDDLKELGVRRLIDTEDAAQKVLANFGRISASSQPIVLCFDQLDNIPRFPDGSLDLQALFNVNSSIHTRYPQNLLVIISIINSTWHNNKDHIQPADITEGRVNGALSLKPITLEQAEALWATRLYPLHQQAEPQPNSPIYPLTRQALEDKFPRGKTNPRYALRLGRQLFQEYKARLVKGEVPVTPKLKQETPPTDPLAAFDLVWRKEFKKTQQKIDRIPKLGSPELIQMLQEILAALQVEGIDPGLLQKTKYSIYSFSYQLSEQTERIGILWSEEANLRSFSYLMKACEKALKQKLCDSLILIRAAQLGQSNNAGYRLFKRIFTGSPHRHITPHLNSVHYLATYHSLVNAALGGDLVVGDLTPNLKELEAFIRESQILHNCTLLQELGIVPADTGNGEAEDKDDELEKVRQDAKDYLVTLVRNDGMMLGRKTLLENANREYSQLNESQLNPLIDELCQENKLQIPNLNEKLEKQVVCLVMSPQ
ncbi:AAA family ATPase [Coleofasciculus sp.]|uniref:AAA family ATPase n=1 Tax=Coleofasciculus sp. TaxID=3100458 RepID=UPI0039F83537